MSLAEQQADLVIAEMLRAQRQRAREIREERFRAAQEIHLKTGVKLGCACRRCAKVAHKLQQDAPVTAGNAAIFRLKGSRKRPRVSP